MPDSSRIPSSRVPLIGQDSTLMSREWYRYFSDGGVSTYIPYIKGSSSNPTVTYSNQIGSFFRAGNLVVMSAQLEWSSFSGEVGILE